MDEQVEFNTYGWPDCRYFYQGMQSSMTFIPACYYPFESGQSTCSEGNYKCECENYKKFNPHDFKKVKHVEFTLVKSLFKEKG